MLLKYSCYFFLCVTFPVLNVVSRLKACSEPSMATFRFFTKLWAVIQSPLFAKTLGFLYKIHGLHSGAEVVSRKYFPERSTSETSSVRRGMCGRTILLLGLGWCRSALAIAHFSLRRTESLKMTRSKCCDKYQIYTEKPADPAIAPNSDLGLHKILKKITICCRLISTYIKKLDNHIWYLSQCSVSLLFLVTLFPWVKSEQWLRHSCITPSQVLKLFCNRCLFWLNVSLVDLAGKYSWTQLQLLNVDHGFSKADTKS